MLGVIQKTEVSFSGGGIDWRLVVLVVLLVILVIGLIVWLYRNVRKTIQADDEWHYDDYSLMKVAYQKAKRAEASPPVSPDVPSDLSPPPVAEPVLKPKPEIVEPTLVEPVQTQPRPEPPRPAEAPARPAEPAPTTTKRPVPAVGPQALPPGEPAQPGVRFPPPKAVPKEAVAAEAGAGSGPSASPSPPGSDEIFFHTFEHEVKEEHRSRTYRLAVAAVIILLVAVYFLVFPVQDAVNSAVANVGQRLSQLLKGQPTAPAHLVATPQLDIMQEVTPGDHRVVITGRVRNISSDTLNGLIAEFAVTRRDVELPETRLAPIQPVMLLPNQQGRYTIEISTDEFSEYRLARILTADKQEVAFQLSLALPSTSGPQR